MKANRLKWFLVFLLASAVFELPAQQSEADRKMLAEIRAQAEKGDAQSQSELGNTFYLGSLGVEKDAVEAAKWFCKAAKQNHADAQYNLGVCYDKGQGVVKDYVEAYKWSLLSAEQGIELAREPNPALEARMTREQIAEGQKLAHSSKP